MPDDKPSFLVSLEFVLGVFSLVADCFSKFGFKKRAVVPGGNIGACWRIKAKFVLTYLRKGQKKTRKRDLNIKKYSG